MNYFINYKKIFGYKGLKLYYIYDKIIYIYGVLVISTWQVLKLGKSIK